MVKKEITQPWTGFLKCMKIEEGTSCPVNSYSEGGWAVSTALAFAVQPPGCKLAAFEDSSGAACIAVLKGSDRALASEAQAEGESQ